MELRRQFSEEQFARGLTSWEWIGVGDREPLFASPFGDVFFRADDGIWWLDTLEGSLTRPWTDAGAMAADLDTEDGQDRYLLGGLALGAARRGLVLGPGQVYGFAPPPILGGPIDVDHIMVLDLVVWLTIMGQTHEQIRSMPPGTQISGFTVDGERP
jgi:hypothetical protein